MPVLTIVITMIIGASMMLGIASLFSISPLTVLGVCGAVTLVTVALIDTKPKKKG